MEATDDDTLYDLESNGRGSESGISMPTSTSEESSAQRTSYQSQQSHQSHQSQQSQSQQSQRSNMELQQPLHVDYILVAEFSIDKGPTMEYQYPAPISGDEHMLAELMLPDQTHRRNQDWTVFFLHKEEEETEDDPGQQPLIYVLNLVNTKRDNRIKRGAKVKAMAICTRHSFLHIYKPILLLALEEYFKKPTQETLAEIFVAVNTMDMSCVPHLSVFERQILATSENKEMFLEKFEEMMPAAPDAAGEQAVMTPEGGTRTTYFEIGPGSQRNKLINGKLGKIRDSHEYETSVTYKGVKIPIKVPVAVMPETVGDFSLIQLITTFSTPHSQNPQPFPLHPHLTTNGPYTHPVIVLVNALLTQKRIVFLGHGRPSGEVANHVLAACYLASGGVLKGFTRHAFPYTDISKIEELLYVNGFIAGVINPMFANQARWWDVLCDIDTGRIRISPELKPPPLTDGLSFFNLNPNMGVADYVKHDTMDNAFMEDISHCISSRFGEWAVRARWRDWVLRFTRMATAFEEAVYGASALWIGHEENHVIKGHGYVWADEALKTRDLTANAARIEGWRGTRSYLTLVQESAQLYQAKPIKIVDLHHQIDRLRVLRLSHEDSEKIYMVLKHYVDDYEEINQLLCVIPETQNGIFPIAFGLFHPNQKVRFAVVELLEKISTHMAGRHFFNNMNRFQRLAYIRLKQERENSGGFSPVATEAANGVGSFSTTTTPTTAAGVPRFAAFGPNGRGGP
ncbi:hypothetical protein TWF173_009569 [Orbilia oligospora]|uniref:UDENN domain-containing protein n=1 Tax=Orbilia oligospora TaxID=2813651 RepID=A0A7C8VV52_ORBOL|nr:hypothetical protein TWF970_010499 [Orbilia oligospora]KAF3285444.1 hypothetical protein TWF970_010499 [Orbilia oligospora]KAF3310456.1 hypothetical protein TWF173_009569 [Orbilia oligospora]KAF3310457.1 hypothetical protein TWF173_009569 [Orbilia oligospora]